MGKRINFTPKIVRDFVVGVATGKGHNKTTAVIIDKDINFHNHDVQTRIGAQLIKILFNTIFSLHKYFSFVRSVVHVAGRSMFTVAAPLYISANGWYRYTCDIFA